MLNIESIIKLLKKKASFCTISSLNCIHREQPLFVPNKELIIKND